MLRAAARLHRDHARHAVGEVLEELRPRQLQIHDLAGLHVDPVQLEHPLRRIHPDDGSASLHSGPSGLPVKSLLFPLGTLMPPAREGPPQPSGRRTSGGGRRPSHLPFPSEELGRALRQDPVNTLRVQGQRHSHLRRRYKLQRCR